MTRQQFIDDVTGWYELIDWCRNHGCPVCEDIYSDESRDMYINDNLVDMARDNNWYELRDILGGFATGYDYWHRDEYDDWYGVDDDEFDGYRNDVLNWADENGEFDEEEDDDYGEADEFEVDTSVSLDDFFVSSAEDLSKIASEAKANEAKANADFNKFTQRVTTVGDY